MAIDIDDVKNILPVGYTLTDPQIQAAIDAACCMIDQLLSGCLADYSDACLDIIKTQLAAHFATVSDQSMSLESESQSCGKSSATYGNGQTGILSTTFGQMANTLSGGCLAECDLKPAKLFAIGCA